MTQVVVKMKDYELIRQTLQNMVMYIVRLTVDMPCSEVCYNARSLLLGEHVDGHW